MPRQERPTPVLPSALSSLSGSISPYSTLPTRCSGPIPPKFRPTRCEAKVYSSGTLSTKSWVPTLLGSMLSLWRLSGTSTTRSTCHSSLSNSSSAGDVSHSYHCPQRNADYMQTWSRPRDTLLRRSLSLSTDLAPVWLSMLRPQTTSRTSRRRTAIARIGMMSNRIRAGVSMLR
jgi:hypothetical protein